MSVQCNSSACVISCTAGICSRASLRFKTRSIEGRTRCTKTSSATVWQARAELGTWFPELYRDCINSMFGETDEERLGDLNSYREKWYSSMRRVNWHDSHIDLSGDDGSYFGY